MNIHEYQAKEIFRQYGVLVPSGKVAFSVDQAVDNAQELGGNLWVVKAQIHAGGRGLGGGVKVAKSIDEVKKFANDILGMTLVTHQTGPKGKLVEKIYIEKGIDIKDEFYLSITLDRTAELPTFIVSTEGGMDIEKVARKSPEKIIKVAVDPTIGFQPFHARKLCFGLGIEKEERKSFFNFLKGCYDVYMQNDAGLVEINPLVRTSQGEFMALDAKMNFDDSALYRHNNIESMKDESEEDKDEKEASLYGLSYVSLDGEIGCMVNGAGLAMGTMDAINALGGKPANFLDVGGGANKDSVAKGFEIILNNPSVKAIFVNIFGGIVRCDRIANGILQAAKKVDVQVPVIVRLDGTNANEASNILKEANLKNIIVAFDLEDGALKSIQAAK